jgi:hypothetical protein
MQYRTGCTRRRLFAPRHLIVCPAIELSPRLIFANTAPLLEEECDSMHPALPTNRLNPVFIHRPSAEPGLPAHNDPIYLCQGQIFQRADQRFTGQELDPGWSRCEIHHPIDYPLIFDADSHPYIRRPGKQVSKFSQTLRALRENLESMLRAFDHRAENGLNEIKRDVFLKQVAHRIHEDNARLFPPTRDVNEVVVQRRRKAVDVASATHRIQALRHPLCVAMLATLTDLYATSNRVPGHLCPFNRRSCGHECGGCVNVRQYIGPLGQNSALFRR